jgi:uncharacterized protein YyaL (SSP411 family)
MTLPSDLDLSRLPKDGGDHYNRLVFESSLYLRNHAHQGINWYPWRADAFELAKIANKPIFLSVGYSSCHWCHVMSETTFDRTDVAEKLNKHFVSIKVDRDEHPDIDHIYMAATQLLTQRGGWPNSVFCLPTGQPFFAGTYFAPDDSESGPGFLTILDQLAGAWREQRHQIDLQAQELERVIKKMNSVEIDPVSSLSLTQTYQTVLSSMNDRFDPDHGGFGSTPKFPPFSILRLLLANQINTKMVSKTLTSMALSGMYDQVDGGFHRYSTDADWHLPHFEKMLSDNAQMIELYAIAFEQTHNPIYQRIVEETILHLQTEWRLPNGGYLATIDADSNGQEGAYYTMSADELSSLGSELDTKRWHRFFQFSPQGNVLDEATGKKTGVNVFHPIDDNANFDMLSFKKAIRDFRQKNRQFPVKDTRLLISANALLVNALFIAGKVFTRDDWVQEARRLFSFLMDQIQMDLDRLYVNDITYLLYASLVHPDSEQATTILWDLLMDRFYDHGQGGLWFSQELHRTPMSRIKDIYDQAEPAVNGLLISIGFQLAFKTKNMTYYRIAMDTLNAFLPMVSLSVSGTETFWLGVQQYWTSFGGKSDIFSVQVAQATRLESGIVIVTIDLESSYFLDGSEPFAITNDSNANWLKFQVDPMVTRRFSYSDKMLQTATGSFRISGRIQLSVDNYELSLMLPFCSNDACFPVQKLLIPIA